MVRLTLIQTADHWAKVGDTVEIHDGKRYVVTEIEQLGPPEFVLGYTYDLIPAKVILTLEPQTEEGS